MRTNETTCTISGLKIDVVLTREESITNSLAPQFESVQVIIFVVNKYRFHIFVCVNIFCLSVYEY